MMSLDSSKGTKRINSIDKSIDSDGHSCEEMSDKTSSAVIGESLCNGKVINKKSHNLRRDDTSSFFSMRVVICIVLWYLFSFTTLFLNKYIVSYEKGDTTILGMFQMLFCSVCGYIHMRFPLCLSNFSNNNKLSKKVNEKTYHIKLSNFTRSLIIVGCLRFATILLGLIALWYVPVSFAETIKSSAPVFTVMISRCVLGEHTPLLVNLSLIPVMFGLALCSAYELSFSLIGFIASLSTNLSECFQNVLSKKLLSVEKYDVSQMQFYTSVSSFLIQIPCLLILVDVKHFFDAILTEKNLLLTYILAGISFHCQSVTEYLLLSLISPVTHSVANTAKRALLIWLSVLTFGNSVTTLSWIGTGIIIFGVLFYNKARKISLHNESINVLTYQPLCESETHNV